MDAGFLAEFQLTPKILFKLMILSCPSDGQNISGLYVLLTGRLLMLETQSPPKTNDARKTVHSNTDNEGKLGTPR